MHKLASLAVAAAFALGAAPGEAAQRNLDAALVWARAWCG